MRNRKDIRYARIETTPTKGEIDDFIASMKRYKIYDKFTPQMLQQLCGVTAPNFMIKKLKALLNRTKYRASKKGFLFSLPFHVLVTMYFIQNGKDPYTGFDLSFVSGRGKGNANDYVVHIDRIDSNRGYTRDNIVLVCWSTGRARGRAGTERFDRYRSALAEYATVTTETIVQSLATGLRDAGM